MLVHTIHVGGRSGESHGLACTANVTCTLSCALPVFLFNFLSHCLEGFLDASGALSTSLKERHGVLASQVLAISSRDLTVLLIGFVSNQNLAHIGCGVPKFKSPFLIV